MHCIRVVLPYVAEVQRIRVDMNHHFWRPNVYHGPGDDLCHRTCLNIEERTVQQFAADVTNSGAVDYVSDDLVNLLTRVAQLADVFNVVSVLNIVDEVGVSGPSAVDLPSD